MRETLDSDTRESRRRERARVPRLVRVLSYERLEAGGGPVHELAGLSAVSIGGAETERSVRAGAVLEIDVADPYVSKQHARLVAAGSDAFEVQDLGSKNGVLVEGSPTRRALLEDGQIFETGRTAWMLRMAPATLPPETRLGPTRSFSPSIGAEVEALRRVADKRISILISGETGTGKEVFARAVHETSGRRGRFVAMNCGALASGTLEGELFGHRRGAFTGALADRTGLVEAAHGGTLFLDEIGEMPADAQVRLLRVLEEREVLPLGETVARKVDVRFLAASHRDLQDLMASGRFRGDLYARLAGHVVRLPRLAERREDIGELIAHAVRSATEAHASASVAAGRALLWHAWPFNVRELTKAVESALALAAGGRIELEHLPEGPRAPRGEGAASQRPDLGPTLDDEDRALYERIVAALRANDGNVTRAALELGKQRQQLQRWMRRLGIRVDQARHEGEG